MWNAREGYIRKSLPLGSLQKNRYKGKEKGIRSVVFHGPARAQVMDNQNLPMSVAD